MTKRPEDESTFHLDTEVVWELWAALLALAALGAMGATAKPALAAIARRASSDSESERACAEWIGEYVGRQKRRRWAAQLIDDRLARCSDQRVRSRAELVLEGSCKRCCIQG